jgi:putative flippase GtrA
MQKLSTLIKYYGSMWRWALVGSTTSVIDYLLFISLYSVINSVFIANFCAGLFSITFNYLAHYFWSFKSGVNHSKSGIKYLVNLLLFWSFGTVLLSFLITSGIDPKIAKLIPIPLLAPLSFLSLKYFVFKGNKSFLSKNQGVS